jgi:hypothetical protein
LSTNLKSQGHGMLKQRQSERNSWSIPPRETKSRRWAESATASLVCFPSRRCTNGRHRHRPGFHWGNQHMLEFSDGCPHRLVMILRCIVLLLSLALAGCCVSGVGCTARAPDGGVAWDGLGPVPEENAVSDDSAPAGPQSASKRSRQQAARSDDNVRSGNQWEQQQASDQAADTKLTRQLKICSSC